VVFRLRCTAKDTEGASEPPFYGRGDKEPYPVSRTIQIGGEGGWDYLAADEANRHLTGLAISPLIRF
jgi:hypothetical protein